jgi:hypothetical protein
MSLSFTYKGSEALEMLKTTFPKTWENEIKDGQQFIKALMNMYQLTPLQAFQKFVNQCGNPEKGISTFASLHVMLTQNKIGNEIQQLQDEQLAYGNQLTALEKTTCISFEDKKTLRSHYLSKQDELQKRIHSLTNDYPVIGSETIIVQTSLFEN